MNFIHQLTLELPTTYKCFKATTPQQKLEDPNIGCGHFIRAFSSEYEIRKALHEAEESLMVKKSQSSNDNESGANFKSFESS